MSKILMTGQIVTLRKQPHMNSANLELVIDHSEVPFDKITDIISKNNKAKLRVLVVLLEEP